MSNGINVNPLNDITKVYLNQIANAKAKETEKDIERWTQAEETECNESPKGKDCDVHGMKECPDPVQEEMGKKKNCGCGQNPCITYGKQDNKSMKEEKKAKKDYDGDGTVESGAKEYRGVIHNKIQQKMGKKGDGKDTSKVESFNVKSPVIFSKPEEKTEETISEEMIEKHASAISKAHKSIKK